MKEGVEPELITLIRQIILHWCNKKPIQLTVSNSYAVQAFNCQNLIGRWKNFMEGFWSNKFVICQTHYFHSINSQKSPTLLMSKLQRKFLMISWHLWTQRNTYLHEIRHSIHPQEEEQLDNEITYEYKKGIDGLSSEYRTVFNTSLNLIINRTIHNKVSWLFGIWAARENVFAPYLTLPSIPAPNTTLRHRYIHWKSKTLA